jgi:long-chain acyl-CoA synthetase
MGDPKGVILTNDNIVSNVHASREVLPFGPGDVLLSFVPLNHVMGRMADHYLPLSGGSTIAYVENLRRLRQNILEVRPHYMVLVPRVFEMFREALIAAAEKEKPFKRRLFFWALGAGTRAAEAMQHGAACPAGMRLRWWLADYEKVRRFVLLDHDFRIEDGELTPTLKVRRKVVLEKYREVIEGMYGAGEG